MGLHNISDDGQTIEYHCLTNPDCSLHNCANWEEYQSCQHHDQLEHVLVPAADMRQVLQGKIPPEELAMIGDTIISRPSTAGRVSGRPHQVSIHHPEIEFTGPDMVGLPRCTGTDSQGNPCTSRMFVKVSFTDQELAAPNIRILQRDPANPQTIVAIIQHPMVARHQALGAQLKAMGRQYTPPVNTPPVHTLAALVDAVTPGISPDANQPPPAA